MILKFAVGEVPAEYEAAIREEESAYGSFLRIPIERVSKHAKAAGKMSEASQLQPTQSSWTCMLTWLLRCRTSTKG